MSARPRGRPRSLLLQTRTLLAVGWVGRVGEPRGDCAETEMAQGSPHASYGTTQSRLSARTVALGAHLASRDSAWSQASGPHPPIERALKSAQRMMQEDVIGLSQAGALQSGHQQVEMSSSRLRPRLRIERKVGMGHTLSGRLWHRCEQFGAEPTSLLGPLGAASSSLSSRGQGRLALQEL